jgi:hypothetical protein
MDVLSTSGSLMAGEFRVAWYENDGNENFTSHLITGYAFGPTSVYAEDIDGDGDMDVLSASSDDNLIAWYENDGNENFTSDTITTSAIFASSVYAVDVNSDGDMDVLSASRDDNKIAWYENDGNENFTSHTITTSAIFASSVYAVDVDSDGDMDVLSASEGDNKIAWYENDGNENFRTHAITTDARGALSVYAVDVDSDGDMDVLSAASSDHKIAWYENQGPVGIDDMNPLVVPDKFHLYNNYPNPFNPTTKINYQLAEISFVALKIYDVLGNEIATLVNEENPAGIYEVEFNGNGMPSGIYFYQLRSGNFIETKKMVLLK